MWEQWVGLARGLLDVAGHIHSAKHPGEQVWKRVGARFPDGGVGGIEEDRHSLAQLVNAWIWTAGVRPSVTWDAERPEGQEAT